MSDKYVWSGWFHGEAYEPYTLSVVLADDGESVIYRGDERGYVYVMDEKKQWKDATVSNQPTGISIMNAYVSKQTTWFIGSCRTIECWCKISGEATIGYHTPINIGVHNRDTTKINFDIASGTIILVTGDYTYGVGVESTIGTFSLNTWYHLSMVRDSSTGEITVNIGTLGNPSTMIFNNNGYVFSGYDYNYMYIGVSVDTTSAMQISDLRIWSKGRTLSEINSDKDSFLRVSDGLMSNVRFTEGTGGYALDSVAGQPRLFIGPSPIGATESWEIQQDDSLIQSEIRLSPVSPYGIATPKRCRDFIPFLYQKYDGSTTVQWVIDGRIVEPDDAEAMVLRGNVAYWDDETTDITTEWNSTVWNEEPVTPHVVTVNQPCRYIQFIIKNAGSNSRDEISYAGAEVWYQPHRMNRVL